MNLSARLTGVTLALLLLLFYEKGEQGETNAIAGAKAMNEKATFAAGCFWGVEYTFSKMKGVISTRVGYTGGHLINPTYDDVCSDKTGHAEAVELEFDPAVVSYEELLDAFWKMHNPTTINRQGPDVGSQYRSAIFCHSEEQKKQALASKERLEKSRRFRNPVVTEIVMAGTFYRAEEYHQKYYEKHPGRHYCPVGF